jgi:hypothetical protein
LEWLVAIVSESGDAVPFSSEVVSVVVDGIVLVVVIYLVWRCVVKFLILRSLTKLSYDIIKQDLFKH